MEEDTVIALNSHKYHGCGVKADGLLGELADGSAIGDRWHHAYAQSDHIKLFPSSQTGSTEDVDDPFIAEVTFSTMLVT
jgi:hypothetical protein